MIFACTGSWKRGKGVDWGKVENHISCRTIWLVIKLGVYLWASHTVTFIKSIYAYILPISIPLDQWSTPPSYYFNIKYFQYIKILQLNFWFIKTVAAVKFAAFIWRLNSSAIVQFSILDCCSDEWRAGGTLSPFEIIGTLAIFLSIHFWLRVYTLTHTNTHTQIHRYAFNLDIITFFLYKVPYEFFYWYISGIHI